MGEKTGLSAELVEPLFSLLSGGRIEGTQQQIWEVRHES